MKRTLLFSSVMALLVVNATVGWLLYVETARAAGGDDPYEQYELFASVVERIRSDYVEGDDLSYGELVQRSLKGRSHRWILTANSWSPSSMTSSRRTPKERSAEGHRRVHGGGQVALDGGLSHGRYPCLSCRCAFRDRIANIEGRSTRASPAASGGAPAQTGDRGHPDALPTFSVKNL